MNERVEVASARLRLAPAGDRPTTNTTTASHDLVAQIHAIKGRVLPSGKVSFDAERNARGHADKFWSVALACQRERPIAPARAGAIGVRVVG